MGRTREEDKVVFNIKNTYTDYPYRDKKHPLYMSRAKYREVLGIFCKKLSKHLILSGEEITLPSLLGKVKIYKTKHTKKLVDHGMTNKIYGKGNGKYVYFNTNKTNGYVPKVVWSGARLRTKPYMSFALIRSTMRYNSYCRVQPETILYNHFNAKGYLQYDVYARPYVVYERTQEQRDKHAAYRAKLEQSKQDKMSEMSKQSEQSGVSEINTEG